MKKLTKFIVLLSVFGLGIAGCDNGKKQDESPKESQTPSTEQQVSSDEAKSSSEVKSSEDSQTEVESPSVDDSTDEQSPSEVVVDQDLIDAAQYLYQLYKDVDASLEDFDLIGTVLDHTVTYKLEVLSGLDNVIVLGELGDNGKYHVTVHYNAEEATQDTTYRLTATVHSNSSDETVEYTFERVVPQFVLTTYDEYLKAIEEGKTDVLNLKAYVVARIAKGSSSFGSIYLQDADGHGYYVYAPAVADELKASDETYAAAFPDGAEVLVSGQAVLYNGQFEFAKGASIKTTGKTAADNNVTLSHTNVSAFMAAAESNSNKNNIYGDALHEYQNALVTIEGAKLLNPDGAYYYFTVGDGEAKFNLYDTYYFMSEEERNALKAKWTPGYTATITGILTVYSYGYQIYPLSQDAVVITDTQMSAEDTANVFFDAVAIPAQISDLTVQLPTAEGVAWTLDEGDNVASLEGNVLTLNPAAEDVNIKLTAVYTIGNEEFTRSFEAVVKALQAGPGSAADPFTVEEAIAAVNAMEDGAIGTDVYHVGGVVFSASYNSNYKSYTIWLTDGETDEAFELYSVGFVEGLDYSANPNDLVGKYVFCSGYLQKYVDKSGKVIPEIPYLSASKSPTGAEFRPLISEVVDPSVGNGSDVLPYNTGKVVEIANAYEDGAIGTDFVWVRGEVSEASYNSKYSSYTIWLKNGEEAKAFELYSVGMVEGLDYSANPADLVGKVVVCGGYLQKYVKDNNVTLEMPYLSAAKSPTGENFTPQVTAVIDSGFVAPLEVSVGENLTATLFRPGAEVVPNGEGYTLAVDATGKLVYASWGFPNGYGGPFDGFYHDGTYEPKPGELCGIFDLHEKAAPWDATVEIDGQVVNAWTLYKIVVPEGGFILTGSNDALNPLIAELTEKDPTKYATNELFERNISDGALNGRKLVYDASAKSVSVYTVNPSTLVNGTKLKATENGFAANVTFAQWEKVVLTYTDKFGQEKVINKLADATFSGEAWSAAYGNGYFIYPDDGSGTADKLPGLFSREAQTLNVSYNPATNTVEFNKAVEGEVVTPYTHAFAQNELSADGGEVTFGDVTWNYDALTYAGWSGTKGIQLGKSAEPQTSWSISTSDLTGTISKVTVHASMANGGDAKLTIKVGDKTSEEYVLTTADAAYEFVVSGQGEVVITLTCTTKAMYIASIAVE